MFPMSLQPRTRNPRRWFVSTPAGSWSNFQPLSLSPSLWFDASNASSITSSSGLVSQWNDLSGNGRHLTQGTSANQPTTGVTTQNGLNVINYNGSTSGMATATSVANFTMVHVFVVAKSVSSNRTIIGVPHDLAASPPYMRWSIYHNGTSGYETRLNGNLRQSAQGVFTPSNPNIFRLESDEGDGFIGRTKVLDSGAVTTLTYPNVVPMRLGFTLANTQVLNGFFAEVLVFNRRLNEIEKDRVITYLNTKWAVY